MSVLRSLLTAGVLASGLLWSLNGITATPAAQASDDRYEVTQQRNPDAACLDCHKPDTEGMHGKHASVINPNNKLPVTCTNCHGQPSPQHREGVKDVMRFNEPMYKVGEQNSVCMSCHLPEQLQKAFWPHDVHVTKVACASCHLMRRAINKGEKRDKCLCCCVTNREKELQKQSEVTRRDEPNYR
ncbi:cytochrome c nitrite reductase pentaheme subunit, partial [Escherichia coli]|uniref:cytochrome c nitrite reductase pentaheme subunit n=1 Tax=Escherichia coli TaxID=562 RepID=UPI00202353ED